MWGFAIQTVASSRKGSAGTRRGYLPSVAKGYRDDTCYWCVLVIFKDLLIIASAAWFWSGVEQQVFSRTLSLAYTFIVALVLPYAEQSAHNADVLTSLMLAMQTLLTAGFGDEDDAESHSSGIFVLFVFTYVCVSYLRLGLAAGGRKLVHKHGMTSGYSV